MMRPAPLLALSGAALIASAMSVSAQPTLGIIRTNNQSLLYWPSGYMNYALQGSTNLATTNWATVSDAMPASYDSQTAVIVSNITHARFFRLIGTNTGLQTGMALIPAGSFLIGNSTGDSDITDASPTNVYVSAFYMDVNLVTYTQWMAVYVFATNVGYNFQYPGSAKGTNHPVENLDWYNAVKWCNARSVQVGLPPVYYTDAGLSHVYTNGQAAPFVNWAAKGFRLPTEAEWEKAARGGAVGQRFPMGNTISETNANYFGEPGSFSYDLGPYGYNTPYDTTPFPYTNPAGSFPTNGYGLSDMAGNLEEWCWDWYGTPYGQPTATDPTGPATGLYRVLRGGYWNSYASSLRCAARSDSVAGNANDITGFRCVRRP